MFDKKVLIVIPIFKGKEYLPDLLSTLDEITYPKDLYKVVIWDDVSPDDTFEVLREMIGKLKYPEQILARRASMNGGFCVNSNRGLRQAVEENYDYVYLLNQDVGVHKDFIQPLVEAMENDQTIQTAQSKILYFSDHSKINSRGNYYHYLGFGYAGGNLETDNLSDDIREIAYPSGAGVMIRCAWLKKIGFLEEYLWMYHEDVYLGLLTWYAGGRNVLVPKSEIYHKYTFNSSMSRLDFMERNR
nr:glycosyltransferase family 2 protein [bacterium]